MFSWIISGLKICRKGVAYAPIRAHYHRMITIFWGSTRRARPHRVPGNSARRARAAADAGIASWSSWRARTRSKAGFAARRAVMFQRPAHFVLAGTTDTFNDRIYSIKRAAAALPSDKNKRLSTSSTSSRGSSSRGEF